MPAWLPAGVAVGVPEVVAVGDGVGVVVVEVVVT